MKIQKFFAVAIAASLLAMSCSQPTSDTSSNTATAAAASTNLVNATVNGQVLDVLTGKGLPGVTVTVGTAKATSDENGVYAVQGVTSGDYNITFTCSNSVASSYSLLATSPSVHVMSLAEFKAAVAALPTVASTTATNVASNFDAKNYHYTVPASGSAILYPNSASLQGKAFKVIDQATMGNATVLPKGSAIMLIMGSSNSLRFNTTVQDDQGTFVFSGLPAGTTLDFTSSTGTARLVFVDTNRVTSAANYTIATLNSAPMLVPSKTVVLSANAYFNFTSVPDLLVMSNSIMTNWGTEMTNVAVTETPKLVFSNTLTKFDTTVTALTQVSTGRLVDATVTISDKTLTFTPTSALQAGTRYQLNYSVSDGVHSINSSFTFVTASAAAGAVSDLSLDTLAKYGSGYNGGESTIYVKFTADKTTSYTAQYKLTTDAAWTTTTVGIYSTSGDVAHATIPVGTWASGDTLQVRIVGQKYVRAALDPIGGSAASNVITVTDSVAPTAGSLIGATTVPFAASVNVTNVVSKAPTATETGYTTFYLNLGTEVLGVPVVSGLSTDFGTPDIQLSLDKKSAQIRLPVLAGKTSAAQSFKLQVADGAGNLYGTAPMTVTLAN